MAKILTDNEKVTLRTRNIIWAVGAMHRGNYSDKPMLEAEWSVEEPRWLVSAETSTQAVREIARENAADLARACWDDRSQRCLYIMQWDRYHTDAVPSGAEINQITLDGGQIVRYHRRWV